MVPSMSTKQAAVYLGMSLRWMYQAVAERKIPHYRVGGLVRFSVEDLNVWLRSNRVEAASPKESRKQVAH